MLQRARDKLGAEYGAMHVRFGDKLDHEATSVALNYYARGDGLRHNASARAAQRGRFVPFEAYAAELLRASTWRGRRIYVASDAPQRVHAQIRAACREGSAASSYLASGEAGTRDRSKEAGRELTMCDLLVITSGHKLSNDLGRLYHEEGYRGNPASLSTTDRYMWTETAMVDLQLLRGSKALLATLNSNWGRLLWSWSLGGDAAYGSARAQEFVRPWFDDQMWTAPGW